jgi:hypothetical protein
VDATGRPARARQVKSDRCPQCGAGPDTRVPSGGFGRVPYPICNGGCDPAYEFVDEVWNG